LLSRHGSVLESAEANLVASIAQEDFEFDEGTDF